MASSSRKTKSDIRPSLAGSTEPEEIDGAPYHIRGGGDLHHDGTQLIGKRPPESAHPSVPATEIVKTLQGAEKIYTEKVNNIHQDIKTEKIELLAYIEAEKQRLLEELEAKRNALVSSAKQEYEGNRQRILDAAAPTSPQPCSLCFMPKKILASICIDCGETQLCSSCLTRHIKSSCKCSNCGEVTNFICNSCEDKRLREVGWFGFDKCRDGCGYLCPEHIRTQKCCRCGSQSYCYGPKRRCKIGKCDDCGRILCSVCKEKQGYVCG